MAFKEEILIGSKADTRGFRKAETAAHKLQRQIKSLGATIGLSLGTAAVINFGKASVRAFAADQAAATRLAGAVNNLGLSMSNPAIARFITNLEKTSGVADDSLRPAFQALLTTTGDLVQSQTMLRDAIDISRGSGIELTTVAQDLANAFVGNTRGLKKYNLGLTQTQLKTMSVYDIQKKLTGVYSGASAKYLETYAGKMERLSTAAGTAQETIGEGLVNALLILSGNTSAAGLAADMQEVADNTKEATENFATFIKTILGPFDFAAGVVAAFIRTTQPLADLVFAGDPTGFMKKPRPTARRFFAGGQDSVAAGQASRAARKAEQDRLKAVKSNTAELKKQALLKKAGSIFDLEQIQLIAALKGQLSDEDRKRVELQFALLTGNTKEAQLLTYELAKAQGLGEKIAKDLASLPQAANPFASWEAYLDMLMIKARQVANVGSAVVISGAGGGGGINTGTGNYGGLAGAGQAGGGGMPVTNVAVLPKVTPNLGSNNYGGLGGAGIYGGGGAPVIVQIDGKAVASALQDSSLSGIGSSVNRITSER
jgi:hypothetical protein